MASLEALHRRHERAVVDGIRAASLQVAEQVQAAADWPVFRPSYR